MNTSEGLYRAPWSKMLIGLSLFSTVIIVGVGLLMFSLGRSVSSLLTIEGWLVLSVLPISALFIVRGYSVRDGELIVQRLLWKTSISLRDLRDIYCDPTALSKSLRTFGNGGCLSFTGWFYSKKLGHFRAFATAAANSVVLVFEERRTIVITPERPQDFEAFARIETKLGSPQEARDSEPLAVSSDDKRTRASVCDMRDTGTGRKI